MKVALFKLLDNFTPTIFDAFTFHILRNRVELGARRGGERDYIFAIERVPA